MPSVKGHVFITAGIAWVSISSWEIKRSASSEVTLNDADSCKAACLDFTGCRSVGWTQATRTCSLHDQTRLQVGKANWKQSPGDQYFEFYFNPLGTKNDWLVLLFEFDAFSSLKVVNSSHKSQCIRQISHNEPLCFEQKCPRISVRKWCIVGYGTGTLWHLWHGSNDIVRISPLEYVSLRLMTSQFKDIISNTQKLK